MDFKKLVYCTVEMISYAWNLDWTKQSPLSDKLFNKSCIMLKKKKELFKNMEIKDCGFKYNQWLGAEAGDHLNNSHQHFINFQMNCLI